MFEQSKVFVYLLTFKKFNLIINMVYSWRMIVLEWKMLPSNKRLSKWCQWCKLLVWKMTSLLAKKRYEIFIIYLLFHNCIFIYLFTEIISVGIFITTLNGKRKFTAIVANFRENVKCTIKYLYFLLNIFIRNSKFEIWNPKILTIFYKNSKLM